MSDTTENIRYFIYSKSQFNERKEIEKKLGKKFYPGYIIIHGVRQPVTQITKNLQNIRYTDYKLVATADINKANYMEPYAE